jgi:glycosyltransferase involved in cell wall biosynthesis
MGLAVAKHEFVAFLDADDVCHPDRLGRQAARLQAQPDLSLIGASARKVDVAGRPVGQFRSITDSNRLSKVMLWYNCLTTSTIMVRQSLALGVGGFDPRLVRLEDYDLWLRLLARAEGAVMAEALIDYRVHPGQLSRGGLLGPSTKLLWGSRLALARRIGVTPAGAAMRHMAWVAIQVANRRW